VEDESPVTPRVFLTLKFMVTFLTLAVFAGICSWIGGLRFDQAWPLILGAAGLAGLYAGIGKRKRLSADFVIPSLVFFILSAFFCLFAFGVIQMRLKDFILLYWPALFALSLILLALGAFFSRKEVGKDRQNEKNSRI
jgi:hypothetical protein